VTPAGGDRYTVKGDLAIRGQAHPVELGLEVSGPMNNPWGAPTIGFELEGRINRKQWGLEWNVLLEAGSLMVSDEVRLVIEAEANGPTSKAS